MDIYKITEEYFSQFNMIDFVIQSYNSLLDNIQNIIQKYDFKYYFFDVKKREILLQFLVHEVNYQQDNPDSITFLRQRTKDYLIRANINMDIVLKMGNEQKNIPINDFFLLLPIVTNCKYDPILKQSVKERWDRGQDITQLGGDIIFKGIPYLVQNTLSQPFNKPIINKSDKDDQIVFANYLYQSDVIFGNSYYTTYALLQDKENNLELDRILRKAQVPIFLIFRAYGIKTDEEAIQFCNPENDTSLTYFLINIIRNGFLHKEYKSNITVEQAKSLFIDKIRNQQLKASDDDISKAIEKYIRPWNQGQEFAYTLGEIIKGIYQSYTTGIYSNRDSLHNKRVRMIGQQIYREILQSLQRSFNQSMHSIKEDFLEYNFDEIDKDEKFLKLISQTMNQMSLNCSDILVKSFVNSSFDKVAPLQKTLNEQKNMLLDVMQKRQIVIRSESMGGKVSWDQRKMQLDFYGFICPISTPEGGGATGRYQSPAIYSYISQARSPQQITEFILKHKFYQKNYTKNSMPIKVNFNTIGFVKYQNFKVLYDDLMKYRLKNSLLESVDNEQKFDLVYYKKDTITRLQNELFTSIYYQIENNPHIGVWTDYGRIMTPIMQKPWKGSLKDMIKSGKLIYVCPDMMDNFIVQEYSSSEKMSQWYFLPQGSLGEMPSYCSFSGNQKAIRALYSSAQMKQNISIPYTNPMCQMTNQQLTLTQPQSSIVDTAFSRYLFQQKPLLQIVYLCLKPYTFNQEDAIVSNEGYFYRNGATTNSYKSFYSILEENEQFKLPNKDLMRREHNYRKLNKEGFINKIGLSIQNGDILIGKVKEDEENINESVVYDLSYPCKYNCVSSIKGLIGGKQLEKDAKETSTKKESQEKDTKETSTKKESQEKDTKETSTKKESQEKDAKETSTKKESQEKDTKEQLIQTQLSRYPTEGDKFVSRNAQKGTIGIILPEYQLDILESGIVPTFFGNPAGIVKRETYGQMIEPVMGQYLAENKLFVNDYGHDLYSVPLLEKLSKQKMLQGYSRYGNKLNMGFMGGPMMYSVQKHLVAQKIYAIDKAIKNKITNQPGQGRRRHGGMRIGNLEQSSFYAQGISQVIKDQAGINSSFSNWYICNQCHTNQVYKLAVPYEEDDIIYNYNCPRCGYTNDVQIMGFSYQPNMLQKIMDSIGCQLVFNQ